MHFLLFRFGAFETFKTQLQDENKQLTAGGKLLAGLGAGVCEAILAVTPMETVKVKFINDQRSANPKFRGFFHGVSSIIRQEGMWSIVLYFLFEKYQSAVLILSHFPNRHFRCV